MAKPLPVTDLIPQREPFVMIDELIRSDERTSTTRFRIRPENIFVVDGYFREPGLTENIAQTAAARAGYIAREANHPVMVGYIGAVKNLEIFDLPRVEDELETEITIENQIFEVTLITGRVTCDSKLVAQCEMKIFITQTK